MLAKCLVLMLICGYFTHLQVRPKQSPVAVAQAAETVAEVRPEETPVEAPKPVETPKLTWKESLMSEAGIAKTDWVHADYIISHESSWRSEVVNPNGGACGLVQSWPCSKLGPNWKDPIHQLKWQKVYVEKRYGGYEKAAQFWRINRWY